MKGSFLFVFFLLPSEIVYGKCPCTACRVKRNRTSPSQKVEEERRKGWEVQQWNARMSSLLAVQRAALDERSGTTAAGSTADEKQQQGEAVG